MFKKLFVLCVALILSIGTAFAAVEVNTADQSALESVKGLGPVKSKAIIDERSKNGPFKDADDLAARVKGLGTKSVTNLEHAGLTIGGSSLPPSGQKATRSGTHGSESEAVTKSAPSRGMPSTGQSTVRTTPAATGATSPAATVQTTPAAKVGTTAAKMGTTAASSPASASASAGTKKSAKQTKAERRRARAASAASAT